ncbi:MAG: hypothetical protein HOP35_02770 [Nitrospira sp.]|nr:hypothetical protein [Nitrospira sp.]
MKFSWPVYIALAVVGGLSFLAASYFATADFERALYGSPATLALIGALYQILRDHSQHEKARALQQSDQHFILGITSHMADVAFDKHVEFCEKYMTQMQKTLSTLFQDGPSGNCLELSSQLANIRLSSRTWLTADIQNKILPFEEALTQIAGRHIMLNNLPVGDERTKVVQEMHNTFADVLGLTRLEARGENDASVAPRVIMDHLQDILGVKQLVQLRIKLVDQSVKTLEKNS